MQQCLETNIDFSVADFIKLHSEVPNNTAHLGYVAQIPILWAPVSPLRTSGKRTFEWAMTNRVNIGAQMYDLGQKPPFS